MYTIRFVISMQFSLENFRSADINFRTSLPSTWTLGVASSFNFIWRVLAKLVLSEPDNPVTQAHKGLMYPVVMNVT